MPNALFEEGTEITVDSETVAVAAGWTDAATSVAFRDGHHVSLAIRAKNGVKAASLVCTLPAEYRPSAAVVNETGTVEVLANGEVKSLDGATSLESATNRVYEISYAAAVPSP